MLLIIYRGEIMRNLFILLVIIGLNLNVFATDYPSSWWQPVPETERQSWEILPQDAKPGEVILSKRTELGVFSNLAATPFILKDTKYASIEGLWQMMKYPDPAILDDERNNFSEYTLKRSDVCLMAGFDAKHAGDAANSIMKAHNIKWISFEGEKFFYKDNSAGSIKHYDIIYAATVEKIKQNPNLKELLIKTGDLILKADHNQDPSSPPSYKYFEILMKIRKELQVGR